MNVDAFLKGYVTCALWSSTDEHGAPLDDDFGPDDIAPETLKSMREDCTDFVEANAGDLAQYPFGAECAGHDFWLPRNRHGAGFWDRGLGDLGKRLTDAARVYGSVDLYAGDDGRVYA